MTKERLIGWGIFLTLIVLVWWGSAQPGSARVVGVGGSATLREVVVSWVQEQKQALAQAPKAGGTALTPGPSGIVVGDEAAENAILEMINGERARKGLSPLEMDEGLRARARERSRDMLERGYFSHNDPETGVALADYTEIIAKNVNKFGPSPLRAARAWWESPDHYVVMIRPDVRRIGIGVARSGDTVIVTAQLNP